MSKQLNQIVKREGVVKRVKPGVQPVVELELEPNQYVAAFDLRRSYFEDRDRKTEDWYWTAYIVTRL